MKKLITRGAVLFWCLAMWVCASWAGPGQELWKYPSQGGLTELGKGILITPKAIVNQNGDRILVTSKFGTWIVVCLDREGQLKWQRFYSGPGSEISSTQNDKPRTYSNGALQGAIGIDAVRDSNGNIIVVGFETGASPPDTNIKVVSYSPMGDINWSQTYDSGERDQFPFVAVNSKDQVFVVETTANATDYLEIKLLTYSPTGQKLWEKSYSGPSNSVATGITIDSQDNVIVTAIASAHNKFEWHILSYSENGTERWCKSFGSTGDSVLYAAATDSHDNIVAVGTVKDGSSESWKVISYTPSGTVQWERTHNSGSNDTAYSVAIGGNDTATVVGMDDNGKVWKVITYDSDGNILWEDSNSDGTNTNGAITVTTDPNNNVIVGGISASKLKVVSYGPTGTQLWENAYPATGTNVATSIAIDENTGEVVVAGSIGDFQNAILIDYEGYPPPPQPQGHILVPEEVRTIQPAAEVPDSDNGKYLGFGDVVVNGTHFKIEAAFPEYLNQGDNSILAVKIFIAAQMPDDYSRLAYFDSSNNLKYQPPDTLSSWKASVSGEVVKTTVMPEVDVTSAFSSIPAGTHYWYTLVVPDTVPDNFAGVDWATTPWEITVNIFDVQY